MKNYKTKSRGMSKMLKKTILIASCLLIATMVGGCTNSTSKTNKAEKLALTKANVQKVFKGQYNVENINLEWGSIDATFVTKNNVDRKETSKLIKNIQAKIKLNFTVKGSNSITVDNYDYKLLGHTDNKNAIVIGYIPYIYIETNYSVHKHSMETKFNLLNPTSDVKITAKDHEDGDLTSKIKLKNTDVLNKIGTQTITYEVTDSDGNTNTKDLNIEVTK